MSEAPAREWRFYVKDMIVCAEKVAAYTAGLDQAGFVASGLNYDATLRNMELIGEAATRIPEEVSIFRRLCAKPRSTCLRLHHSVVSRVIGVRASPRLTAQCTPTRAKAARAGDCGR